MEDNNYTKQVKIIKDEIANGILVDRSARAMIDQEIRPYLVDIVKRNNQSKQI